MTLGGDEAAWDTTKGRHFIDYDIRLDGFPTGKPQIVGGQIHDDEDDLVEVLFTPGKVTWRIDGSSSGQKVLDFPSTGARCRLEVVNGTVNFYVNDLNTPVLTSKLAASTKAYFKVGNYLQSNTSKDPAGSLGKVSLRNVVLTHTTVSGPSQPPSGGNPPPATAQPIVMVIRHGEKPAGSVKGYTDPSGTTEDSHSLTLQGWQRAQGLVGLFNPASGQLRAGLYKPTKVYAADGSNAGDRMKETVSFLSPSLGLSTVLSFDKGKEKDLAKDLKALKPGDVALVCWEHSAIPDILKNLGTVTPKAPKSWPDDRFDEVFVLVADGKGGWNFTQVPELVLPSDSSTPIK